MEKKKNSLFVAKCMKRLFVVALVCCVGSVSCTKDPVDNNTQDPDDTYSADAEANRWIYSQMVTQYLYNDYTKSVTPNYNQTCELFFTQLLSRDAADNDGKHTGDKNYFYSYMERTGQTKASSGVSSEYGMDCMYYYTSSSRRYISARVLFVVEGSPADRAGIRRGDWIVGIDGRPIGANETAAVESGGAAELQIERMSLRQIDTIDGLEIYDYETTYEGTVAIEAAETMDISPILMDTVFTYGGKKIGYLVYNEFNTGPGGVSDVTYDNQLKEVFASFQQEKIDELILDLRYNPGGYASSCQLLCSMIAPRSALGDVFCYRKMNDDLDRIYGMVEMDFFTESEMAPYNLDMDRVFVLSGAYTASASELVINSLRPYMNVYLIGTQTEGKNVGSIEITSSTHGITLHPIYSQAFNKNKQSDYSQGFIPDEEVDEIKNQDQLLPLGDSRELLMRYALARITNTPVAGTKGDASLTAPSEREWIGPTRLNRHVEGMIFTDTQTLDREAEE